MLKALLKKQFLELNAFYFQNKKTGKNRSKIGTALFVLLFVFIFVGLGFSFFGIADRLTDSFIPMGLTWLYFSIMGVMAMLLGVLGSIFNTYSGLYHAKDNELLLSMPIQPSKILFVRMIGVYAMGLLYEAIILVPSVIVFWIKTTPDFITVLIPILLVFIIALLVLSLTCILGWVVALISSKLKNKSFITVILSLSFIVVYYFFCGNFGTLLNAIVENAQSVGHTVKNAAYPLYLMGRAGEGDIRSMLLFTAIVGVFFALTYYVLSKSFIKIATKKEAAAKTVYKEKPMKVSGVESALLYKEMKHFLSSPTYMLNCALGTVIMPCAAVAAFIFKSRLMAVLSAMEIPSGFLGVIAAAVILMALSMNDITAPSVSLEGKSIYILQSMPVPPEKALEAKLKLHWVLTMPPAVIAAVSLAVVLGMEFSEGMLLTVLVLDYTMLSSSIGLVIDLKKPNLSWTNETIPVKQSMGVLICLLGGWLITVGFGIGGWFALKYMELYQFFTLAIVVFALLERLLDRYIKTTGARIFEAL